MVITGRIQSVLKGYLREKRSKKVFKNVINLFLVKILSTVVTLSLIPISLHFTDPQSYGVWLTISSFITSVQILDLGLSNGLANRLAVAFSNNNNKLAKEYISTTYSVMGLIASGLVILFLTIAPHINWNKIFNTTIDPGKLYNALAICFLLLCATFLLKPVNDILRARQKHFLISITQVAANITSLAAILFLGDYFEDRFTFLVVSLAATYPLGLLVSSLFLYSSRFKAIRPVITYRRFPHVRSIFGISFQFFIINAAGIAIYSSTNMLISYFVNPESVTVYTIAYRLFSIALIFQLMILTPLWPAYTEAFSLRDYSWIRRTINHINRINLALSGAVIVVILIAAQIYNVWIGSSVNIPSSVNVLLGVYVIVSLYKENYVSFLNGAGKLRLQVIFSIWSIILQVPLAYLFMKVLKLGVEGIILQNILLVLVGGLLWKYQYNSLMPVTGKPVDVNSKRLTPEAVES